MEEFIGIIKIFGGNFAPRGWAFCNGQLVSIAEYEALYSLIGTTFGGDGQVTFALPDLRSRKPIGTGQGPGLSSYVQGQTGGVETVTLTTATIPAHSHNLNVSSNDGNVHKPTAANAVAAAKDVNGDTIDSFTTAAPNTALPSASVSSSGSNSPHNNIDPFLATNYIICLEGIYPTQN